jgi:hypothetical protein
MSQQSKLKQRQSEKVKRFKVVQMVMLGEMFKYIND